MKGRMHVGYLMVRYCPLLPLRRPDSSQVWMQLRGALGLHAFISRQRSKDAARGTAAREDLDWAGSEEEGRKRGRETD
jgi:hypothetical protein